MIYNEEDIYECIFLERLNRFVARVVLDGNEVLVHVKNTGRCKELLIEGRVGYLVKSHNKERKYQYDLVAIYKDDILVNIDSQLPNKVVYNYIKDGNLFDNIENIKREVTYKNSRFDIYVEYMKNNKLEKAFIEVKGVTLFEGEYAKFPDAPTDRGAKHLYELVDAKGSGYKAYAVFLIQAEGVKYFSGNVERDEKFCKALSEAYDNGVEILCFNTTVTKANVIINEKVEFISIS